MATKRMVSSKIVDSDAFLDMPQTSQLLYFHLCMRTDDDGFIGNPKKIMRMIGSAENDITILFTKKFILGFDSGVIVIKHHRINNNWDKHNCKRTQYLEEFNQLKIKENGSYTLDKNSGLPVQTEFRLVSDGKKSLEENRRDKKRIEENNTSEEIAKDEPLHKEITEIIKSFETINPECKNFYGNKTQRKACEDLIKEYGYERVLFIVEKTLIKTNDIEYLPNIQTPKQLSQKWSSLESGVRKLKNKQVTATKKQGNLYW